MLPIFGIASFVLWLRGLYTTPGDSHVHFWLVGAGLVLLAHLVQQRRALRRGVTAVSTTPEACP